MTDDPRFLPGSLLGVLNEHQVKFVVIGGVAARLHGSIRKTGDVDVCPEASVENADRLAAALRALDARIFVDEKTPALPFAIDGHAILRLAIMNLLTRFGRLDVIWDPPGSDGYDALDDEAVTMDVLGETVRVTSLSGLIRMKAAAGRPKDMEVLADLRFILDTQRRRSGDA